MEREDCACGKMGCYSTQIHRRVNGILRSTTEVKNERSVYIKILLLLLFEGLFRVRCLTTQLIFRINKSNLSDKNEVLQSNTAP